MIVSIPTIIQGSPSGGSIVSNPTLSQNEEQGMTGVTLDEEGLLQCIAKLTLIDKEGGDGVDSDQEGEEIECHGEDIFEKGNDTDSIVEQAVLPEKEGKTKAC
jgi:hypothetical protein